VTSEDALAFDRHLDATAAAVAEIARALRLAVLRGFPGSVETFDRSDGLLAIRRGRSLRDFMFAIIPHKAHVNLQLADGANLHDRDGRIEGTGKRIRHVKVRSMDDAQRLGPSRGGRAGRPSGRLRIHAHDAWLPTVTSPERSSVVEHVATALVMAAIVVIAALLAACGFREPGSWLTVHNRTTVPIVAVEHYDQSTWLVAACATRAFRIVGRGPAPDAATEAGQIPRDAVRIPVSAVGPADASSHTVIVVSAEGIREYVDSEPPSALPPCEGTPVTPAPSASTP